MSQDEPVNGEIQQYRDGEWARVDVTERRDGYTVVDRRRMTLDNGEGTFTPSGPATRPVTVAIEGRQPFTVEQVEPWPEATP